MDTLIVTGGELHSAEGHARSMTIPSKSDGKLLQNEDRFVLFNLQAGMLQTTMSKRVNIKYTLRAQTAWTVFCGGREVL